MLGLAWTGRAVQRWMLRPLKDWKLSAPIEQMIPRAWRSTPACVGGPSPGRTPGPATASPWPPTFAAPGKFAQAIADFAETCAGQNECGYTALWAAVKNGRAEAATEI